MECSKVVLTIYDGGEMESSGRITVKYAEIDKPIQFEVIKTENRPYPFIGVETCMKTERIKIDDAVNSVQVEQR